jgi:hypothetical protein
MLSPYRWDLQKAAEHSAWLDPTFRIPERDRIFRQVDAAAYVLWLIRKSVSRSSASELLDHGKISDAINLFSYHWSLYTVKRFHCRCSTFPFTQLYWAASQKLIDPISEMGHWPHCTVNHNSAMCIVTGIQETIRQT